MITPMKMFRSSRSHLSFHLEALWLNIAAITEVCKVAKKNIIAVIDNSAGYLFVTGSYGFKEELSQRLSCILKEHAIILSFKTDPYASLNPL